MGGEEASKTVEIPFTKRMRKATAKIHNVSDTLVNVKLGLTISDETVWKQGILTFSCVFKHLEQALERNKDSLLGDLAVDGLTRAKEFDNVLRYYFGNEWEAVYEAMKMTPAVTNYLQHLVDIERQNPYLLAAYIYHLYMGLLSGGQILKMKRSISGNKTDEDGGGEDIFHFSEPHTVQSVKKSLRSAAEEMGNHLDKDTQELVINEGIRVFELNNTLINSVEGVDEAFWKLVKWWSLVSAIVVGVLFYFARNYFN